MPRLTRERLPFEYLELSARGYLAPSQFQGRDEFVDGGYLWFNDMQWMPLDLVLRCEQLDGQDRNVVPFARTCGGDLWAWYNLDQAPSPVVFCPHDDCEGTFFAPSFASALFRHILDFASQNNFCETEGHDWEMTLPLARQHLKRWKHVLALHFPSEWIEILERLLVAELHRYQAGSRPSGRDYPALITPDDAQAIAQQYLAFDRLDETFDWISDP